MCGIGGIRRFGQAPINIDSINLMFLGLQHRGMDAAGIAITNGAEVFVYKTDQPAWNMLASRAYKDFVEEYLTDTTDIVLVHTRAATEGLPRFMKNNHPLYSGTSAIIHNGCISNHRYLFEELKLERTAETDSDIIRAIFDDEGFTKRAIRILERMSGSAAIAAVSPKHPGELILARSGNPLILAADTDHLYWASTKSTIHAASRPWESKFNLSFQRTKSNLGWLKMPEDTAYFFDANGFVWHQEFKIATHFKPANYGRQFTEYESRNKRWDKIVETSHTSVEEEIRAGLTCAYSNNRKMLAPRTTALDENIGASLEDHSHGEATLEDARTLVQCELCAQWSYITEEAGDVNLEETACGHCGRHVRVGE